MQAGLTGVAGVQIRLLVKKMSSETKPKVKAVDNCNLVFFFTVKKNVKESYWWPFQSTLNRQTYGTYNFKILCLIDV